MENQRKEKGRELCREEEMLPHGQIRPDPVVKSAQEGEAERRELFHHAQICSRKEVTVPRDRLQDQKHAAPLDEPGKGAPASRSGTVKQADRFAGESHKPARHIVERSSPAAPREHRRVTRPGVFGYVLQVIDELQNDAVAEQRVKRIRLESA